MHHVDELRRWVDLGTVLYVGAHGRKGRVPTLLNILKLDADAVICLEAHYPNVIHLRKRRYFNAVVFGDITRVPPHFLATFDTMVWWHGPEHVALDTGKLLLKSCPCANVWVGCPNGPRPQGPEYDNPYEAHQSTWYPQDFLDIGYQCNAYRYRGNDYLTGWRRSDAS